MPNFTLEQQLVVSLQLLVATVLSMAIGLNREKRAKDAGMRTHMLVGIGSCLFSALSLYVFPDDPARVAANIVTGIGFLGAGVIYKGKNRVHDLTTAASVWITAAIGMAVGLGAWFLGVVTTLIVWVILDILRHVEKR